MAHFAELTSDNIVLRVIVVNNSDILDADGNESEQIGIAFCKSLFGQSTHWAQTSYNASFRGKYATMGDTFDPVQNLFIPLVIEQETPSEEP